MLRRHFRGAQDSLSDSICIVIINLTHARVAIVLKKISTLATALVSSVAQIRLTALTAASIINLTLING